MSYVRPPPQRLQVPSSDQPQAPPWAYTGTSGHDPGLSRRLTSAFMNYQEQFESLISRNEEARLDFLRIDLALSKTFVDVANTEMQFGEFDAVHQVLAKAEQGYETVQRLFINLYDPRHQAYIRDQLDKLGVAMDAAQQRLDAREREREPGPSTKWLTER
jgi:hypothetical protein